MFSFRKLHQFALGAAFALVGFSSVNAAVLTFDSQPEAYFIPSVTEAGYSLTSTHDGFGTNNHSLWPSNGTTHLMSWTNNGSISGFTIKALDNAAFSINSFLFASGYLGGSAPVTSLVVSGTGGNAAFSQTFTSGTDYNNFGPGLTQLFLTSGFTATEYTFIANGSGNRAIFDNIVINEGSSVPEPTALALFGIAFAGLGLARRK